MTSPVKFQAITARWHTDAGHAWLEVHYAHLEALGVAHRISRYSYRDGDTVYLEEDCDADVFFEAADLAYWDYGLDGIDYPDLCFIRARPRYSAGRTGHPAHSGRPALP
jgi:hypothetical protein